MRATLPLVLLLVSCHAKDTPAAPPAAQPPDDFWTWFAKHEDRLANEAREKDATHVMEEISGRLEHAEPGLIAELAINPDPTKPCTVVISADGKRELFDKVKRVAAAAPPLKRWSVTAFRPRRDADEQLEIGGRTFAVGDFFYREVGRKAGKLDIEVAVRGLTGENHDEVVRATFLELDTIVGELDAETKLGEIGFVALPDKPGPELKPLTALAKAVDSL